jgi:hypothetical protein
MEALLSLAVGPSLRLCGELGQRGDGAPVAVRPGNVEQPFEPRRREPRSLNAGRVLDVDVSPCYDRAVRGVVRRREALGGLRGGPVGEEDDVRTGGVAPERVAGDNGRELPRRCARSRLSPR